MFFLRRVPQALAQPGLVQRCYDLALGTDALVCFHRAGQRRQRQAFVVDDPAAQAAGNVGTRNLQHLAVADGGYEAAPGTGSGQNGVGCDRRAVHDMVNLLRSNSGALADPSNSIQHADRLIGRCARDLGGPDPARTFIHEQQIGESAADVDSQAI